jgi:hypothetical protein
MSASERLASAVMQGQHHGSVGRWRRGGGGSGRDMRKKIAAGARGRQKMAAARRWQQRWAAEGKVCSRDAGRLNSPPPPRRLERERSASQHLTSALEGSSTPGGGEERLVARRQWRSYSAGNFWPGVEAQLRLFVAPNLTRFRCCRIASSGPTSTSTINDDALVECTRREGGRDDATTTTATMTMPMSLWGGGARCGAYSHVGVDSAAGRR